MENWCPIFWQVMEVSRSFCISFLHSGFGGVGVGVGVGGGGRDRYQSLGVFQVSRDK